MAVSPPNIDQRTAAVISEQLQDLVRLYAAPQAAGAGWELSGLGAGLTGVAARFSEIVIQRLNQVPQKNFLAFLNLLGAALLPPQPARVPLTFYLANGSLADGLVPAGTQVASPPGPGEKDPVIFETEKELIVTAAQLVALYTTDPARDMYSDYSAAALSAIATGAPVFHGQQKIEHVLYVGDPVLASPGITGVSLHVAVQAQPAEDRVVQWEFWTGTDWNAVATASDTTNNLQQSGDITFASSPVITQLTVPPVLAQDIAQTTAWAGNGWLRGRLMTPITTDNDARSGMVRSSRLPLITALTFSVEIAAKSQTPKMGFINQTPIDVTKDFYPFGEKPKFADSFYLELDPDYAQPGATVTLTIKITNPAGSNPRDNPASLPPYGTNAYSIALNWEVWTGVSWKSLGTSSASGPAFDTTNAFTKSGTVTLKLPGLVKQIAVGGVSSVWLRVRIAGGHYGLEAHWESTGNKDNPYTFVIDTFTPPVIGSVSVDYDYTTQSSPGSLLTYNNLALSTVSGAAESFSPFVAVPDLRPTLYFGFNLPAGRTSFLSNPISLFLLGADLNFGQSTVPLSPDISKAFAEPGAVADHKLLLTNAGAATASFQLDAIGARWTTKIAPPAQTAISIEAGDTQQIDIQVTVPAGTAIGDSDTGFLRLLGSDGLPIESAEFITYAHEEATESQQLQISWEYWNGFSWSPTAVADNTNNFAEDGVVEFLPPPDFAASVLFGLAPCYWLHARWEQGEFDREPRLSRVLPNTVMGSQTVTIQNEVLGSSDGSGGSSDGGQQFQSARFPVLAGQSLRVLEPEMPSAEELKTIRLEEGDDAVSVTLDAAGQPIWVRWHEVPDFYASDARSRHYTLDHLTGQVTFGDGLSGLIPPIGTGNLQLQMYKTGGGTRGNRAAGTIVQLKTTLPYVDKVMNLEPAAGGAEPETTDSLIARAPTEIRHRHRAVTSEDYEDLAHLASPGVARALCVSDYDLLADPFTTSPPVPGNVSVIIVPQSSDSKPQPSFTLIDEVQQFLASSSPANVSVVVVGPMYVRVEVQAEIGLASLDGAGTVVQKIQNQLAAFLHPLTGGVDGAGWQFGRAPHRSDLYAVLKQIPEADHVRSLVVTEVEDPVGARDTGRALVYSGSHSIQLVYEPS